MIRGYKVFTHDLRSPIQGGHPVWSGSVPFELPTTTVDESDTECGAGWNFCREAHTALQIAGLWPDGRPSRLFVVEGDGAVERGDKCRAASLRIVDEVTDIRPAIVELSKAFDEMLRGEMVKEQLAWRHALARPMRDGALVEQSLALALEARGLDWRLRKFDSAWDAMDAWDARAAWAARDVWDAWDAWDARAALTVLYASRMGWTSHRADLLTVGLRDAYEAGLAVAIPVGPRELGWAMVEKDGAK